MGKKNDTSKNQSDWILYVKKPYTIILYLSVFVFYTSKNQSDWILYFVKKPYTIKYFIK